MLYRKYSQKFTKIVPEQKVEGKKWQKSQGKCIEAFCRISATNVESLRDEAESERGRLKSFEC